METIEKNDAVSVKITASPKEEVITLEALNNEHSKVWLELIKFEQWVLEERAGRQALVDAAQARVDKAKELGVDVAKAVEAVVEIAVP